MSDKNFLDLQPGDVVVVRDIYSHDSIPYKFKINSVERDKGFVTETNPNGIHYCGDCFDPIGDEYFVSVDESNFEEFLYHGVVAEITPMFDGYSFKVGSGTDKDGEYDAMVDIPEPGDENFHFYLMYENDTTPWNLTEEEKAHVKDEIGAYLRRELDGLYFDENNRLDEFKGGWMLFKNGASMDEISNWIRGTFEIPVEELASTKISGREKERGACDESEEQER